MGAGDGLRGGLMAVFVFEGRKGARSMVGLIPSGFVNTFLVDKIGR